MDKSSAKVLRCQLGGDAVPSCHTFSGNGKGADVPEPTQLEEICLEKNPIVSVPPEFPGYAGLGVLKYVPPVIIPGLTFLVGIKVS